MFVGEGPEGLTLAQHLWEYKLVQSNSDSSKAKT